MQQYLREHVDWPQAFSEREYAERVGKVHAALTADGLDAIYVTHPANLTYLTGYDMIWKHLRSLTGVLIRADSDTTVFFDERALLMDDPDHSEHEDRFILLGLSAAARTLVVVHCYRRKGDIIRIISARKANRAERDQYRRRLKR